VKDWRLPENSEDGIFEVPLVKFHEVTQKLQAEPVVDGSFLRWTLIGTSKPAADPEAKDIGAFVFIGVSSLPCNPR
jgi:hypothetical protein